MPNTNAPEQSPNPTPFDEDQRSISNAQRYFLIDFATLTSEISEGINNCLEVIDATERYHANPARYKPETKSLTLSIQQAEKMQSFAVTAARLLGEYSVQQIAWINHGEAANIQTLKAGTQAI